MTDDGDAQTTRMKQLVLWRAFSSVRRVIPAVPVAFASPTLIPSIGLEAIPMLALAFAMGPFALPLAVFGPLAVLDAWVWYVVLLTWTADMAYFAYYEQPALLDALRTVDVPRLPGRDAVAADGGTREYSSVGELVGHFRSTSRRAQLRWTVKWLCVAAILYLAVVAAIATMLVVWVAADPAAALVVAAVDSLLVPVVLTPLYGIARVRALLTGHQPRGGGYES